MSAGVRNPLTMNIMVRRDTRWAYVLGETVMYGDLGWWYADVCRYNTVTRRAHRHYKYDEITNFLLNIVYGPERDNALNHVDCVNLVNTLVRNELSHRGLVRKRDGTSREETIVEDRYAGEKMRFNQYLNDLLIAVGAGARSSSPIHHYYAAVWASLKIIYVLQDFVREIRNPDVRTMVERAGAQFTELEAYFATIIERPPLPAEVMVAVRELGVDNVIKPVGTRHGFGPRVEVYSDHTAFPTPQA